MSKKSPNIELELELGLYFIIEKRIGQKNVKIRKLRFSTFSW